MYNLMINKLNRFEITVFILILVFAQIVFLAIGKFGLQYATTVEEIIGIPCENYSHVSFYRKFKRDASCEPSIELNYQYRAHYIFELPLQQTGPLRSYSRWQKYLTGVFNFNRSFFDKSIDSPSRMFVDLYPRLKFKDIDDNNNTWQSYSWGHSILDLDCSIKNLSRINKCDCTGSLPLFKIGTVHHDYHLLEVYMMINTDLTINENMGSYSSSSLSVENQTEGFTSIWIVLKTTCFFIVTCFAFWYWRRVCMYSKCSSTTQSMILSLGLMMAFLNVPLECLTLIYDIPYMFLLIQIRQHIFNFVLLSFSTAFIENCFQVENDKLKHQPMDYYLFSGGCISFFIFMFVIDIGESSLLLIDAFWINIISIGFFIFIFIMLLLGGIYLISLAIKSRFIIIEKGSEYKIYRIKVLIGVTIICTTLTLFEFILKKIYEHRWEWQIDIENNSMFSTGIYGMWNIYTIALLYLFAPASKPWMIDINYSN